MHKIQTIHYLQNFGIMYDFDILSNAISPIKGVESEENDSVSSHETISKESYLVYFNTFSLDKGILNPVNPDIRYCKSVLVTYHFIGWVDSGNSLDLFQKANTGPHCDHISNVTTNGKYGPIIAGIKISKTDG